MTKKAEILVAMSGGVDSAVSALICNEASSECIGATMKLFDSELLGRPIESGCCSVDDIDDAKDVCHKIGIPHFTLNCKEEFTKHVVDPFVAAYIAGRTPNPCIACNKHLKFDVLIKKAKWFGADIIATGHYAKIEKVESSLSNTNALVLKRGDDPRKDQSYVLHTLTKEQLPHIVFPIGHLSKNEVRDIAAAHDMIVAEKKESQDICFVENGSVDNFISHYTKLKNVKRPAKQGTFVDEQGQKLGTFPASHSFTIGQRKGLNLAMGHPVYVTNIDKENNIVTIGEKEDLIKEEVVTTDFNWISISPKIGDKIACTAKIRYNMNDIECTAIVNDAHQTTFVFPDGVSAPAKGQSAVCYDGDIVLGGGFITSAK